MFKPTAAAFDLMLRGSLALADMEANGFRIDTDYLRGAVADVGQQIKAGEAELRADPLYKTWQRAFSENTNLDSNEQLGHVLFNLEGYEARAFTDTGKPSTDESALERVGLPFTDNYVKIKKLKKLRGTYLEGILGHTDLDGFLHAFFNLHLTKTYRSQSDSPNLQNIPIREPEIANIIRRAFIPRRKGNRLIDLDYSGAEVRVAACYHHDPRMIDYLTKGGDMHRDVAAQLFFLDPAAVPKMLRQIVKGQFVFAEFYGSYFAQCAPGIWEDVKRHKVRRDDGLSLIKHLRANGITGLGECAGSPAKGTFEDHVRAVEDDFWGVRFPVYDQWRRDWYEAYKRNGGFQTLTGFAINGPLAKNDVINYPVQGSAFHCLLWSLIEINKELKRRRMASRLVVQIHDSITGDVPDEETDEFIEIATRIMTEEIRRVWDWIIVPMEVEIEITEPGEAWSTKKAYKAAA